MFCLPDKREALENRDLLLIPPLLSLWTLSWQDTKLRDVTALLVTIRRYCYHCIEVSSLKRKSVHVKISPLLF